MPDHLFGVSGRWDLRRCVDPRCGLVWQDPMVIDEDLWMAYERYYTHTSAADTDMSALSRWFLTADRWSARWFGLNAQRRRMSHAYLDEQTPGRLLDVGCGDGRFAARMQRLGWSVRGTDFDPKAAANAGNTHGIEVDVGDLRQLAYQGASYDAVVLRHVIEHVREPMDMLRECWRILKPGGRLVIVTPNIDSLGHRHFKARWRSIEQPRHLFLYGPSSMRALLQRAGIAPGPIFSSAQGAAYVLRSSAVIESRGLRRLIDAAAIWWLTFREASAIRRGRHVGEELVVCAVKPGVGDAG